MTMTLGRVGTDGTSLPSPQTINQQGGQLSLIGVYSDTSANGLFLITMLRNQLLGYVNNFDVPVIPVTFTEASQLDGFYRPTDVAVTHEEGGLGGSVQWLRWQATLTRASYWRQPRIEAPWTSALLTNSVSATVGTAVWGVPGTAADWSTGLVGGTRITRTGADGAILVHYTSVATQSLISKYQIPASAFYQGGATIEVDVTRYVGAGAATPIYRTVTGRPAFGSEFSATSGAIRIHNNLVRVSFNASTSAPVIVEHHNGTSWGASGSFKVYNDEQGGAGPIFREFQPQSFVVIRNRPEECCLRVYGYWPNATTGIYGRGVLDVSLRRGSRWATFTLIGDINVVGRTTISQSVATTYVRPTGTPPGVISQSANNAAGNRTLIANPSETSVGLAAGSSSGAAYATGTFIFGIGSEIGGTGATGQDVALPQAQEFFAAVTESQQVVAG